MKEASRINKELTDHLLGKVISYATKADLPLGNIIVLNEILKEGLTLLSSQQRLTLVKKLVTKNIFKSILNYGKNSDKDINNLCHDILLFNRNAPLDAPLVARLLEIFADGSSSSHKRRAEEVIKKEIIIDYKIEVSEAVYNSPVSNQSNYSQTDDQTDYQAQRYGNLNKDELNLSKEEVNLLNLFWITDNIFTKIEQCAAESAKLYLHLVTKLESHYNDKGANFLGILESLDKVEIGNYTYNVYYPEYHSPVTSQILSDLFKVSENSIREHYRHTRKRDTSTVYQNFKDRLDLNAQDYIESAIASYRSNISDPTSHTLLSLNELNRARWKDSFAEIKSRKTTLTPKELLLATEKLIQENERNPSIANIHFEAMRLFSSINRIASLKFYINYYASKLKGKKSKIKPLPKTVSKKIFTNKNQEEQFHKILVILRSDGQLIKAINEVPTVFKVQRKKLKINQQEILKINETHKETVEKLNVILNVEEEEILSEEVKSKPIVINKIEEKNLESIFGKTPDKGQSISISFDPIQKEILLLFKGNNFSLTDEQVSAFAKKNHKFKGQLINGINELFYEIEEDVLIEDDDGIFSINKDYITFLEEI